MAIRHDEITDDLVRLGTGQSFMALAKCCRQAKAFIGRNLSHEWSAKLLLLRRQNAIIF